MSEKIVFPKISVLIPVYNVEKYVERCILSILNQTMQKGVEVIIVNDCTPDRSMDIIREVLRTNLKENGMTVRIVEHETNRGLAAARNTAMSYATGDYTIHVDSDDYVELDMLEKMYDKALETDADIVLADNWDEFPNKKIYMSTSYSESYEILLGNMIGGRSMTLWNKLIHRSLYVKNNITWDEGYDMAEDYMVIVPLCFAAKKIVYLPCAFYHYVQYNTSSITKNNNGKRKINGWIYAMRKIELFLYKENIIGFEKELAYAQLIVKCKCVCTADCNQVANYFELYPSASRYKWYFINDAHCLQEMIIRYLISSNYIRLFCLTRGLKKCVGRFFFFRK